MRAALLFLAFASLAAPMTPAFAGENTIAAATASDDDLEQIPLSAKLIDGLLDSRDAIAAILDKIPEDKRDDADPDVQAALDKAARGFGFKDYGELDLVATNAEFLLAGFDPETKAFVGHAASLKAQIADIEADSKLRPKQKERQIKDLRETLGDAPPVKYAGNIPLIAKYYDKLSDLFADEQD